MHTNGSTRALEAFYEELHRRVRLIMFLPFAPELARITGGELIRPYEISRVLNGFQVPLRLVVYGREPGRFEPLGRGGLGTRVARRWLARAVLEEELRTAQAQGQTAWLYLKTPPDIRYLSGLPLAAEPFFRLLGWFRSCGGKVWCNMHDLAPDQAESMRRRGLKDGTSDRPAAARLRRLGARLFISAVAQPAPAKSIASR